MVYPRLTLVLSGLDPFYLVPVSATWSFSPAPGVAVLGYETVNQAVSLPVLAGAHDLVDVLGVCARPAPTRRRLRSRRPPSGEP